MKIPLLLSLAAGWLFGAATYTNCDFKTEPYEDVCREAVKKGVSLQYANEFLLSEKAKQRDFKSFKLFSPKKIKTHQKNEKRANNTLVKRVPQIVDHLIEFKDVYDFAEAKYRVNREIVAGILIKETNLGKIRPGYDAFTVFNTLLVETVPRTSRDKRLVRMAKNNMVSIIEFCYRNDIGPDACNFESSYAGAVGIPQFMPQNFGHIEGYKKKVGDLSNMEDAIVSASRFLHYNADFKTLIDWEKMPKMEEVENAWYDYEFNTRNASFAYAKRKNSSKTYNCFSCDKPELAYLREYAKAVMRYNNSSHYAIGVIRLAYDAHQGLKRR